MMLRRLRIEHFRGIERVDWRINRRLVALVGAGDSTKTTLMDAIGLVLSPSYNPQFTDADFYNFDLTSDIVIEAVVTELPDSLVKEGQLGKDRSGLMPDGTLVHDPVGDAEECLVVRLTVMQDLEPTWEVIRPESDDSRPISANQRRQLGFFRLGERPDFHFRWARGSALSALTDGGGGASTVILDAHREARAAVFKAEPNALHAAATAAQESASTFGAAAFAELRPGLEPSSTSSAHALLLHKGEVPLSSLGLGTRRLTSLAIQDRAMETGSIIAIDELEHGLEPHRLAQAIYRLRQRTDSSGLQIIMTTHSPIAVTTLTAADVVVVHADGEGTTTCRAVSGDLDNVQGTLRAAPAALLSRRVMVGEGATEVGFLRGLLRHWDAKRVPAGGSSSSALGTVLVNGAGGTQPTQRAMNFQQLGYPTCMLLDDDVRSIDLAVKEAEEAGVTVYRWANGRDLEGEVIHTLPIAGLQALVDLAVEVRGEVSIRAGVESKLVGRKLTGTDVLEWKASVGLDELTMRTAIAEAAVAKRNEWFKREDRGEELAGVVIEHWDGLDNTTLMTVIGGLREFAYPEASTSPAFECDGPSFDE